MKKLFVILMMLLSVSLVAQEKMNVILFLVDDLGYYDLSMTGSDLYETPNIDAFAKTGMTFTNAYTSHPRCVPSRYGIQTGKYPARGQVPGGKGSLKASDYTIGEAFKAAGYTTFFAGKWHLGKTEKEWPQNQGYDVNKGGCAAGAPISYFYPYNEPKNGKSAGKHSKIIGLDDGVKGEYLTDRLTEETIKFINEHKDGPFFAMLSHYAVHTPFQAKQDYVSKYKQKVKEKTYIGPGYIEKDGVTKMHQDNAVYAAMIESMDESLGHLIQALKEAGIYEKTAIVVTSDHGGLSNRGVYNNRKLATSNLPLRAGKGHLLEGGVKVPFIVYWPGKVRPGSITDQVTINTDIYPTLLEIAGVDNKNRKIDGQSIVPALKDEELVERIIYWHSPLARPSSTGDFNSSAIRSGDYKLIEWYDMGQVSLYNVKDDPGETKDLSEELPEVTEELLTMLHNWKKEVNAVTVPPSENRWYKKQEQQEQKNSGIKE